MVVLVVGRSSGTLIDAPVRQSRRASAIHLLGALVATAGLTWLYVTLGVVDHTTIALSLLLIVLVVSVISSRSVAVCASIAAFVSFNLFFLPPVGTLRVADPEQWVALLTLLAVGLVASHLSAEVRRRTEEAAERRQEAELVRRGAELKSALLAALSHDLKTPLTAVTVAAENLTAAWLDDAERREQAEIVRTELTRLNRLFDDITVMAGIETHAVNADPEWVLAEDIIEAAAGQARHALGNRELEIASSATPVMVRVDPRLMSAALVHLIENAGQYSPPGTRITLRASIVGEELQISVADEGPGVPALELTRVFERFYRGAGARQTRFGSGMGLAITRGLMVAQGGRAWAENRAEKGTVFIIGVTVDTRPADSAAGMIS